MIQKTKPTRYATTPCTTEWENLSWPFVISLYDHLIRVLIAFLSIEDSGEPAQKRRLTRVIAARRV